MLEKLNNQEKLINYKKLYFKGGNNVDYDFSEYRSLKELFKAIYYRNITIEKAERIQEEFDAIIGALKKYKPKKQKYKENKEKLLINDQNFYDGRKMTIEAFKNKIFPLVPSGFDEDEDEDEDKKDSRLPTIEEEPEENAFEQTTRLDKFYGADLINKYFKNKSLTEIINQLRKLQKNPETGQEYNNLMVCLIIGLNKLDSDIRNMSEDEVRNKRLDYLKD